MNTVSIVGDLLVVRPRGLDRLWAFRRQLSVPLAHVRGATVDPEARREVRGLRGPGLAFFGKYSYAMYVFQLPLVELTAPWLTAGGICASVGSVFWGRLAYIAVMSALTTLCAVVSWHFFEKRVLRLKVKRLPPWPVT